ncbi:MAG: hypothetical protein HOE14_04725 [Gemmatimonadales bacterium]|jgi:hypothetical protein|nr:hypothetical protein [Gemmatimonadales bacterium]MBT4186497.1 hypothetical protein [Gemmatimonadales bacterium]MBT5043745.1 hypothetical protein [Gemmatimonadales bacterium]MBT7693175.1 hypothetical protein [Gemmatimonadales bacterium]
MSNSAPPTQAKHEYTQLLRLHEPLLTQMQAAREEPSALGTVEETIRALKLSESEIKRSSAPRTGERIRS